MALLAGALVTSVSCASFQPIRRRSAGQRPRCQLGATRQAPAPEAPPAQRRLPPAALALLHALAAIAVLLPAGASGAAQELSQDGRTKDSYFETVPQGLNAADEKRPPKLSALISGPRGKEVEQCAKRCTATCVRGGQGAPGLGPMAVRREIVVFKEDFRSGKYCLSECVQVCSLEINAAAAAEQEKR